jgi:nucleoside-diphosphate-sugar epimerase
MMLVTGAAGVVGSALLEEAAAQGRAAMIIALGHQRPIAGAGETVMGDVSQPRLGLDDATYARLCDRVRVVVHAAGVVGFGHSADRYVQTNVDGTRHVAQLARDARARLVHVSTAFVHDGLSTIAAPSGYEASKREGDAIVREAEVPTVIVRPSIVVGDSRTGAICARQGMHQVLDGWLEGRIRILPGSDSTRLDIVAQDYLARAILAIVDDASVGGEVWITSGPDALRIGRIAEVVSRFIAERGIGGDPVRVIPFDRIERLFIPVFLPALPRAKQAEVRVLLRLARYMNIEVELPSSRERLEQELGLAPPVAPSVLLERNLEALWRRREAQPAEEVAR